MKTWHWLVRTHVKEYMADLWRIRSSLRDQETDSLKRIRGQIVKFYKRLKHSR